jgi:GTP-binding protein
VLAVNKWDLAEHRGTLAATLREQFERLLPQLRGAPIVFLSALTGQGLDGLRTAIVKAHATWNTRIATAQLNRWLRAQVESHPPPAPLGRRIRLRYMTQVKSRPPTFALFCSLPEALPESYGRYLVNGLRETFGLDGTPIRLALRKGQNPFEARAERRR